MIILSRESLLALRSDLLSFGESVCGGEGASGSGGYQVLLELDAVSERKWKDEDTRCFVNLKENYLEANVRAR